MSDMINGRTPEEIKKGLECCEFAYTSSSQCRGCPYMLNCHVARPKTTLKMDALAYIQQLEASAPEVDKRG